MEKNRFSPYSVRTTIILLGLCVLAINGCDAFYFNSDSKQVRGQELRVLTLKSPLVFQRDARGEFVGIDHDLLENFARSKNIHVTYLEKKDDAELFAALSRGEGDLAMGRLHAENISLLGYLAGPAYEETALSLFCQAKFKITDLGGLKSKSVALLDKDQDVIIENRLAQLAPKVRVSKISHANPEQILKLTSQGIFECAIVEDLEGRYFLRNFSNLVKVKTVTGRYSLNWVLRPENTELQNDMHAWFQRAGRTDDIIRIQDHYQSFVNALDGHDVKRFSARLQDTLPDYEPVFRMAARRYKLDWKIIGAIAFQESHWQPKAVSFTGVRGLMQLTEATAEMAGIKDRSDPQESIFGGAFYFKYLWDRLPENIHPNDHLALTLAAYNMGYGNLLDAQKIVVQNGRDPYSWHDVKSVLPKLAQPSYQSQFGPIRPEETLEFVNRVRGYYSFWKSRERS